MDISGLFSEYRKKNGISQQVRDVSKNSLPSFSNLTYGENYKFLSNSPSRSNAMQTEKLHVSFSHHKDDSVKDVERDSGIEILNIKSSSADSHSSSEKYLSSLSNSNTVDDGFVDISSPNDSDSQSSVDSKQSRQRLESSGHVLTTKSVESYNNQGLPTVVQSLFNLETPQKVVRLSVSKPSTPQKVTTSGSAKHSTPQKVASSGSAKHSTPQKVASSGSAKHSTPQKVASCGSSRHGTPQKVSCLKKQTLNSPMMNRDHDLDLSMMNRDHDLDLSLNTCFHKKMLSDSDVRVYNNDQTEMSPSLNIKMKQLSPRSQTVNNLLQNLSLRTEMKSRHEFNSKSDIDDMELVPSYFNAHGFQLDYCWFCGRPMNLNSPG